MAKKRKKKRPLRRVEKQLRSFFDSEFGKGVVANALVVGAVALANSDPTRDALRSAAEEARKEGADLHRLAAHLGRAVLYPALRSMEERLQAASAAAPKLQP